MVFLKEMKLMKSLLTAIALTVASAPVAAAESATKNVYVGSADQGKAKARPAPHAMDLDGNSAAADYPKLAGQHASYLASTLRAYRDGSRENAIMAGWLRFCRKKISQIFRLTTQHKLFLAVRFRLSFLRTRRATL